jgi:hypothetical protein
MLDELLAAATAPALGNVQIAFGIRGHRVDADALPGMVPHAADPV